MLIESAKSNILPHNRIRSDERGWQVKRSFIEELAVRIWTWLGETRRRIHNKLQNKKKKKDKWEDLGLSWQANQVIEALAEKHQMNKNDLISELYAMGLEQARQQEEMQAAWEKLSERKKSVVALLCLGYKTEQIAERLFISPPTVNSHIKQAVAQMGYKNRRDLVAHLGKWDFSEWDK